MSDVTKGVCVCTRARATSVRLLSGSHLELGSSGGKDREKERGREEVLGEEAWPALPDRLCCGHPGRRGQGEGKPANGCVNYTSRFLGIGKEGGADSLNFSKKDREDGNYLTAFV